MTSTKRQTTTLLAAAVFTFSASGGCGGNDRPAGVATVPPATTAPASVPVPSAPSTQTVAPEAAAPPGEFGRNTVRLTGATPADVAGTAVLAAYPPGRNPPNGWVLARRDDWRQDAIAAQFAGKPVNAGILPIERDYLPTATLDLLGRLRAHGFPRAKGLQVLVLGKAGQDVFLDINGAELKPTQLEFSDPARLALETVAFRGGWAGTYSDQVVIVPEEGRDYALPAAAWCAYSGDTLTFAGRNSLPKPTIELLTQRKKLRLETPTAYVVGPRKAISDGVLAKLRRYARVKRISGPDPIRTAIAFARYRDPKTGFGWGLRKGPASVSLVNSADWGNAIAAYNFAGAGPQAPLLLTDAPSPLPRAVARYLKQLRGPKPNQGFVFGSEDSIASATLREMDGALEARR